MHDKEIFNLIKKETQRQRDKICLIPSENYASSEVLAALGTVLNNKYSEGYPCKRYYEGQEFIDQIEDIARERAKKLFGAEHANVQPYSGSPANQAVYLAFLKPGDKVMGMALPSGGHLTHGWHVNFSGIGYDAVQYMVDSKTLLLDYDAIRKMAKKEKPKMIIAGSTAYPRKIDFEKFGEIAKEISAYFLADVSHIAGLIVAGVHQSPVPYADVVMTTTHKTLRGPRGALLLCKKEHAQKIDRAVFPGIQGGPHDHQTAAIAVCLKEAASKEFREYGKQVVKNAKIMADEMQKMGYSVVSGGTDNHLFLIDICSLGHDGNSASRALEESGITTNKNSIPFDESPPARPCGLRLGSPAITSRGMKEKECILIAGLLDKILKNIGDEKVYAEVRKTVKELCDKFPAPGVN